MQEMLLKNALQLSPHGRIRGTPGYKWRTSTSPVRKIEVWNTETGRTDYCTKWTMNNVEKKEKQSRAVGRLTENMLCTLVGCGRLVWPDNLLLALASTVILGFGPRRTNDIFLSHD
jgi:hypothetical protein